MTNAEVDEMNEALLNEALPAETPDMKALIWNLNILLVKFEIFTQIIADGTYAESEGLFAKIFKQKQINSHFFDKFREAKFNFFVFYKGLDFKNQALFLNYLNTLK